MSDNDFGEFDFGGKLEPEVPDGAYTANVVKITVKPAQEGKGRVIAIELQVTSAASEEDSAQNAIGKKVMTYFLPKPKNHKYFGSFHREVKEMCGAFDVAPPRIAAGSLADPDAWKPFLESLVGESAPVTVKNEASKDGREFARVRFGAPKALNLSKTSDEE